MLCVLALTGCGSDNSITDPGGGSGTEPPPVEVTDLTMLTSSPQLPSDGASPATITAIAGLGLILFFTFRTKAEKERWASFLSSPYNAPVEKLQATCSLPTLSLVIWFSSL